MEMTEAQVEMRMAWAKANEELIDVLWERIEEVVGVKPTFVSPLPHDGQMRVWADGFLFTLDSEHPKVLTDSGHETLNRWTFLRAVPYQPPSQTRALTSEIAQTLHRVYDLLIDAGVRESGTDAMRRLLEMHEQGRFLHDTIFD